MPMKQFRPAERRVWTHKDWQEVLGQAKSASQRAAQLQAEKERLVAEGKLRKVVIKEGKTTRIHYEKVESE